MYNILIVDDEFLARNKLHFLLNWNQHGFHILGEASDAKEALAFIEQNAVDVVFTDVSMPDMDGIELAEYIQKHHPQTSVVIFSNYSDFDYVKGAFSANVVDYILKYTLTEESILALLERIKQIKKSSVNISAEPPSLDQELRYRTMVKQAVLTDTTDFHETNVVVAVMGINNYKLSMQLYTDNEQEMLFHNFENIIATILSNVDGFVIFRSDRNLILYMPFSPTQKEHEIMNQISSFIQQINSAIYKFFNFDLLWGISVLSNKDYSVHRCYMEACSMLANQPSKGKRSPFDREQPVSNRLTISMEKNLLSAISDLNTSKVNQCLEQIFADITPTDKVDLLINDLTSIAAKFYNEFGITTPETISLTNPFHSPVRYLEWAKDLFDHIIKSRLSMDSIRHQTGYAHSAVAFIAAHYNDEAITLNTIAKHIGISEQHLSKVFKKETGKNISAYLAEYRIERAKELLAKKNTNLKYLYSDVGFNDNSYFCTVFKKYTGCSPMEYRKGQLKM